MATEKIPGKILVDSREQWPWEFKGQDTRVTGLKTGDYTLEGYEGELCIERKGALTELAQNLTQKRFERELQRMATIPHAYVLCEFSLPELLAYPNTESIPWAARQKIKMTGAFLLKRVCELTFLYGVPFLFCGDCKSAQALALSLFKRCLGN